jgi:hypothetical protein
VRLLTTLMILILLLINLEYPLVAKAGDTPNNRSMPWLPLLLMEEDREQEVTFIFTTVAGQFNTLPDSASSLRIAFNGQTLTIASSPITFPAPPGNYTFTAVALNNDAAIATMGPIQLTLAAGFPLTVPLAFTFFPAFDTFHTDTGLATANSFIYFGTTGRDRAIQYGGAVNDLLSSSTGEGDDWSEQYGGDGDGNNLYDGSSGGTIITMTHVEHVVV